MKTNTLPYLLMLIIFSAACRKTDEKNIAPRTEKNAWELRKMITSGFAGRKTHRPANDTQECAGRKKYEQCETAKPGLKSAAALCFSLRLNKQITGPAIAVKSMQTFFCNNTKR